MKANRIKINKEYKISWRLIPSNIFIEFASKAKDSTKNISENFILKKIEERSAAKQKGDYKLADQIRDELLNKDVIIEDQKGKTTWKFKWVKRDCIFLILH